jgi:paraquat-inducible protein B
MRWKLLKRRWSIAAPSVMVRNRLPWPLRWAVLALMLGLSAAIALWAFEFGRSLAGLEGDARERLTQLQAEVKQLREERDKAQSIANTAESLLKAERAAQEKLAEQVRQLEGANLALKEDVGLFERLVQTTSGKPAVAGVMVRGLQAQLQSPGRLRYQLLVLQSGAAAFSGRYEIILSGTQGGKPWRMSAPGGAQPLQLKPYVRLDGLLEYPSQAVVKTVQVNITDASGTVRATETLSL